MRKTIPIILAALATCLCLSSCSKDGVLAGYNAVIQLAGQAGLTDRHDLEGGTPLRCRSLHRKVYGGLYPLFRNRIPFWRDLH